MKQVLLTFMFIGGMYMSSLAQVTDSSAQWTWVHGNNTVNMPGVYGVRGVAAPGNKPGGRIAAVTWQDKSGNVWLFGGVGYAALSTAGQLNDLWKYNPATNEWTWMNGSDTVSRNGIYGVKGTPSAANRPGGRQSPMAWTDTAGNLWLFGGHGFAASGTSANRLNDLWKYNPATNEWTWISGTNAHATPGVYATPGTSGTPGARNAGIAWTDTAGNFWLFGGYGFATSTGGGYLNDLWRYSPLTNEWTWIGGGNTVNINGIYSTAGGTLWPGGRYDLLGWSDRTGGLWIMGGEGYAATGATGKLNDLWRYDIATNEWDYKKGDNTLNPAAVAGTRGVSASANKPVGRSGHVGWTDTSGDFWMFGGNSSSSRMNDVWKYSIATNEWTWMKPGSIGSNQLDIYGSIGVQSPVNVAGGRASSVTWTDTAGNFWMFAGSSSQNSSQRSSDLWKLSPVLPVPPAMPDPYTLAKDTVCAGASGVVYTIPAVTGAGSYDWEYTGANVTLTANTTSPSNTIGFAANASSGTLRVRAVSAAGSSPWRDTVITVNALPTVTSTNIGIQQICDGDSLLLTASGSSGVTYQWKYGTTNVGTNSNTFYAKTAGDYTVTVTNSNNCSATSAPATSLTVNARPTVTSTNIGIQQICDGDSLLLTASGSTGVTYQWKNGSTNVGTNSGTYYAKTAGDYTVTVTNSNNCSATSTPATNLTVNARPTVSVTNTGSQAICVGDSLLLTASGSSGVTYQWKMGNTNVGTNSSSYYAKTAGGYTVTVTNSHNCSVTSAPATNLTVNVLPVIFVSAGGPTEVCAGDMVTLTATQISGTNYQWKKDGGNVGSNTNIYTAGMTGAYKVVATTTATGCSDSTQPLDVFVYNRPLVRLEPGDTAFCDGGLVRLEVISADTALNYVWKNGNTLIPLAGASFLEITETGFYTVEVGRASVAGCDTTTNEIMVTVYPLPIVDVTWDGETLRATPGHENYQWYNNGQGISGATDSTYVPSVNSGYSVTVTDVNECTGTSPVYNVTNVKTDVAEVLSIAGMIRVYPNPVKDMLHVSSPVSLQASLYSMDGQMLIREVLGGNGLNVSWLPAGVYLLRLADANSGVVLRNDRVVKQ